MSKSIYEQMKDGIAVSADNMVHTTNGALVYKSSMDALVDIDYETSSLRSKSKEDVFEKMEKAYLEAGPKEFTKWLFYVGDIREGKGERLTFNRGLEFLAEKNPKLLRGVMETIPHYTRWDYLGNLVNNKNQTVAREAMGIITKQLKSDIEAVQIDDKQPSLLAKWLPSIQTKKPDQRKIAFAIEKNLGLTHQEYRKMLAVVRDKLNIMEKYLSEDRLDEVDMEKLTSHQNLKYGPILEAKLPDERQKYLEDVLDGRKKMNMGVATPHDIVHRYTRRGIYNVSPELEVAWKMLKKQDETHSNTIVMRDGSRSMDYSTISDASSTTLLEVATALTLYLGEQLPEPLKDTFITFSARPQIVDTSECETLSDKLSLCKYYDEIENTNIEAAMTLLLDTLKRNNVKQEDAPQNILILSDMEFDNATTSKIDETTWTKTLFESIQERYKENGYEMPTLVFWNLNANRSLIPEIDNERGVILLSGFSPNVLNMVLSGEFIKEELSVDDRGEEAVKETVMSPAEQLQKRLSLPRYDYLDEKIESVLSNNRDCGIREQHRMQSNWEEEI